MEVGFVNATKDVSLEWCGKLVPQSSLSNKILGDVFFETFANYTPEKMFLDYTLAIRMNA